jgi:endo-1,4-beta-xylanase
VIVGEWEHKWHAIEARRGAPDFAAGDRLVAFARDNAMAMRGHTLVWHQSEPAWIAGLDAPAARAAATAHIAATAGRWRGRIATWDVVNEAVRIEDGRPDGLRRTRMLELFGPAHLAEAFILARAADPAARLAYNDYGCEPATEAARRKRAAILELLAALRRAGAPVEVLGVQAHLTAGQRFDAAEWRGFLADVARMGLLIEVTELDVNDRALPADPDARDAAVAATTRAFLDASLAEPALRSVLTWGLSDRHSWLRSPSVTYARRADGAAQRPLPLDDALARKPMWHAIAAAFEAAPPR